MSFFAFLSRSRERAHECSRSTLHLRRPVHVRVVGMTEFMLPRNFLSDPCRGAAASVPRGRFLWVTADTHLGEAEVNKQRGCLGGILKRSKWERSQIYRWVSCTWVSWVAHFLLQGKQGASPSDGYCGLHRFTSGIRPWNYPCVNGYMHLHLLTWPAQTVSLRRKIAPAW